MKHQAICALLLAAGVWAQELPVTLRVDVENQVRYGGVVDPSQIATSPVPVSSQITQLNFGRNIVIGDVVAVNGSPAKGSWVMLENIVRLNPNPMPGVAISDSVFPSVAVHSIDFLKPNSERIGSIFAMGFPPPGQLGPGGAIVGGTGAFVAATGTVNGTSGLGPTQKQLLNQGRFSIIMKAAVRARGRPAVTRRRQ